MRRHPLARTRTIRVAWKQVTGPVNSEQVCSSFLDISSSNGWEQVGKRVPRRTVMVHVRGVYLSRTGCGRNWGPRQFKVASCVGAANHAREDPHPTKGNTYGKVLWCSGLGLIKE